MITAGNRQKRHSANSEYRHEWFNTDACGDRRNFFVCRRYWVFAKLCWFRNRAYYQKSLRQVAPARDILMQPVIAILQLAAY